MSLPKVTNVNDRSIIPTEVPSGATENHARVDAMGEGQQGGAVMTQSRAMPQIEQPPMSTQTLARHSEPRLASADTESDLEQRCKALLAQARKGELKEEAWELLKEACRQESIIALSMLVEHINDAKSFINDSMGKKPESGYWMSMLAKAMMYQWPDGVKLIMERGTSFPRMTNLTSAAARDLLVDEEMLDVLLEVMNTDDRKSLLNRLLEASLDSGSSRIRITPSKLIAKGADIYSQPSEVCLSRWLNNDEYVRVQYEHFKSHGYVSSFQIAMNDINDMNDPGFTLTLWTALLRPVPPMNLLEYACQQGYLTVVESVLNNMKPASAAQIAKWLMCHVIAEKNIPKKYAEFVQLMLGKVPSFDHAEGQAILDEWLLVSAMYRNGDAWQALIEAGANSGSLKTFHPDAVIDTLIQNDFWSAWGFFLIRHGGDWEDGPNDGEPRGRRLRQDLHQNLRNFRDLDLLDVLPCADFLRHQQFTLIEQPTPKLALKGHPLQQFDKQQGLTQLLISIDDWLLIDKIHAKTWEDTGLPIAVLGEIDRLLWNVIPWMKQLGLEGESSNHRRLHAKLWFLANLHEHLDVRRLYRDFRKIPEEPLALLRAFAFQSACDIADLAQAKLNDEARQWQQLPALTTRYVGPEGLDTDRLGKRLQKLGLFAPNAEKVARALTLAYQRASGQQASVTLPATVSEQMMHAKDALVQAIARELPACLASVSQAWSAESGRVMSALFERETKIITNRKNKSQAPDKHRIALDKADAINRNMLLDMVTSQLDLLLDVFDVNDPARIQRREVAAEWRKQAVRNVYQYCLNPTAFSDDSDDSDNSTDSEDTAPSEI